MARRGTTRSESALNNSTIGGGVAGSISKKFMAIVLSKKKTRKIKVKAVCPGDNLNKSELEFTAEFKLLPRSDWDGMLEQEESTYNMIKAGLVGIEDFKDLEGNPHPYSEELVEALLDEPYMVRALYTSQIAIQTGMTQSELYKAAKRKN